MPRSHVCIRWSGLRANQQSIWLDAYDLRIESRPEVPATSTANRLPQFDRESTSELAAESNVTRKALLAYQPIGIRCAALPGIVDAKHHEVDQTFIDHAASNSRLDAHDDKA